MAIKLQLEPKIEARLVTQSSAQDAAVLEAVIVDFCQRWQIQEFYLFGSQARHCQSLIKTCDRPSHPARLLICVSVEKVTKTRKKVVK